MANEAALSGNDSLTINERVITALVDADAVTLDPVGDAAGAKTGKNGNTIFSQNQGGRQHDMKIRVLMGSSDDRYLNGLYTQQKASFETMNLLTADFVKKIGDGAGKVKRVTQVCAGGVFMRAVPGKSNSDGDTEQSVATYTIRFANVDRIIE
jgi:hypothetical protein